jgi:hypothetical protein
MSLLSRRLVAYEVDLVGPSTFIDIQRVLELDRRFLIVRKVKLLHTSVESKIDLSDSRIKTRLIFTKSYGTNINNKNAYYGGFGYSFTSNLIGRPIERRSGFWVLNVYYSGGMRTFKLQNAHDKQRLEHYIARF